MNGSDLRKNRVHFPKNEIIVNSEEEVYRREKYFMWRHGRKGADLQELWELENLFQVLKIITEKIAFEKIKEGDTGTIKPLDKLELAHFKLLKETLVDIYKLKYGEKKLSLNTNMGYEEIRELMFRDITEKKESDVSPSN